MYRSEQYFETAKQLITDDQVPPIFVPSYNRPDPKILKQLSVEPELKIVLCIRREQADLYKKWEGKVGFLYLDNVTEIGETRRQIIEKCMPYYSNIFLFDDDITELEHTVPSITSGGKESMRKVSLHYGTPPKRWTDELKLWMYYIYLQSDPQIAISSVIYRPESWHMNYANAPQKVNSSACIQCIWLNLDFMREHGINYRPNYECGNEDYAVQFEIMYHGGKALTITDMLYNCPAINSCPGGCENASGISDANLRYQWYTETAKKFYAGHPGIVYKKSKTGFPSVKFDWNYWRLYHV